MVPFSKNCLLLLFWLVFPYEISANLIDLSQEWEISPVYNANRAYCNIMSVLNYSYGVVGFAIIKDGMLVAEGYSRGKDKNVKLPIFSTTKGWSSMLIGHLIDNSDISLDSTLGEIFANDEDWIDVSQASEKKGITLSKILTFTSGLYNPNWDPLSFQLPSGDKDYSLRKALDEQEYDPSSEGSWEYLPFWHLLSQIILRVSGMTPKEYAISSEIFPKLGIDEDDYIWDKYGGIEGTSSGLRMNPTTLAKIGMLYHQEGYAADDVPLINSTWVAQSTTNQLSLGDSAFGDGYGYQWYVDEESNSFTASGLFGNEMTVLRDDNIIVVITAEQNFLNSPFFLGLTLFTAPFAATIYANLDGIDEEVQNCDFLGPITAFAGFSWRIGENLFSQALEAFPFNSRSFSLAP